MKVNFIMPEPEPEVNSEGEEQVLDEVELNRRRVLIEEKVKQFALKKMAQQFCNWKKRLNIRYVSLNKTPDFDKKMYAKIRDYWEEFKEYKLSEAAKQRSEKNKENAKKKKYHHTMGPGLFTTKWNECMQKKNYTDVWCQATTKPISQKRGDCLENPQNH